MAGETPPKRCVGVNATVGPDRLPAGTDTAIPAATTRHRELPPSRPLPLSGPVRPVWPHQDTPPAAPARDFLRWQVSWLAGHRLRLPSREHAISQWQIQ